MGFLHVLHQFENEIINNVCKEERPEDMLTKTYIANAFLEFVKKLGVEEDDTYYLKWYEEEHKKYLSFVDQIEVENRNNLRKIGINPNEIEAEIEE